MNTTVHALSYAACACVLVGCASAKVCDTSSKTPHDVAANPSGLGLRLLSPGEEPRKPLRYTFEAGEHELSALELVVGASVETEAGAGEGLLPPIAIELEAGPVELRGDDRFRYALRVRDAALAVEAEPEVAEQAADELAVLKGLGGWVEVDARGVLRDRAIHIPGEVPRDLAMMLGNVRTALMSVPFPEEAVGVGARWETERDVELAGLTARQVVTYTLVALGEDGGVLEVTVYTSAPPQAVQGGFLHGYETSGMGSVQFAFDRMTPLSEADVTNQMRVTMDEAGEATPVQSRTRTILSLVGLERRVEGEAPASGESKSGTEPVEKPAEKPVEKPAPTSGGDV